MKHLQNRFWMPFMQNSISCCVNFHVARVAKNNQIIKAVVSLIHFLARSVVVNVMNMWAFCIAAFNTLKTISLQGVKVVFITVLNHLLGNNGATIRTVKFVGSVFGCFGIANSAGKCFSTLFAMLMMVSLNRVKRIAAFGTRYCVQFWLGLFVPSLARLASNLKRVINAKLSRANVARSNGTGLFHKPIILRLEVSAQ